jgi:hypothetical protein
MFLNSRENYVKLCDLKAQKHLYFTILKKVANKKSMLSNVDIFHNFGVVGS